MLADAHISSMGYLWYYTYTMQSLKIVWSCRTVRPSCNQRSVKYGTEIIPSNMVRFLKRTLRSVIVRVELNWHSSLLMVTCPASRAFFAAWLLAFPKSFASLSVAYLVNVYVKTRLWMLKAMPERNLCSRGNGDKKQISHLLSRNGRGCKANPLLW